MGFLEINKKTVFHLPQKNKVKDYGFGQWMRNTDAYRVVMHLKVIRTQSFYKLNLKSTVL